MNNIINQLKNVFRAVFSRNVRAIVEKEMNAYFNSLIAYVVLVVFLLVCGYFFAAPLFIVNRASVRHFTSLIPLLYLFFIPAITMRLLAEEIKTGTIEILFTQPIRDYEILLGKYFSAVLFVGIIVVLSLFYPLTLMLIGSQDYGQTLTSYIGLFLLGASYCSIGVFSSSLSKNQIVSFIISFVICFGFYMIAKLTMLMPPFLAGIVDFIGIDRHFENIARGVIDSRDIIYYFSIMAFFLYASLSALKSRR